jgi:hypothetical protein
MADASTGKVSADSNLDDAVKTGPISSLGYKNETLRNLAIELNKLTEMVKKDAKEITNKIDSITTKIDEVSKGSADTASKNAAKEALAIQRDAATVMLHQFTVVYKFVAGQIKSAKKHYKENDGTAIKE